MRHGAQPSVHRIRRRAPHSPKRRMGAAGPPTAPSLGVSDGRFGRIDPQTREPAKHAAFFAMYLSSLVGRGWLTIKLADYGGTVGEGGASRV